jgi:hypothetical protein
MNIMPTLHPFTSVFPATCNTVMVAMEIIEMKVILATLSVK